MSQFTVCYGSRHKYDKDLHCVTGSRTLFDAYSRSHNYTILDPDNISKIYVTEKKNLASLKKHIQKGNKESSVTLRSEEIQRSSKSSSDFTTNNIKYTPYFYKFDICEKEKMCCIKSDSNYTKCTNEYEKCSSRVDVTANLAYYSCSEFI
jgi:hypothetical protein